MEAIPLTEEWLLQLGLAIKEVADYRLISRSIKKGNCSLMTANSLEYDYSGLILGYDLESVHQLQNLYFVLTGEELTLQ